MTVRFVPSDELKTMIVKTEQAPVDTDHLYTLAELAKEGGKITRVRVLTDYIPGYGRMADISYIHGQIRGTGVHINYNELPNALGFPLRTLAGNLIEWAKAEGVYAKGLGLLDKNNWSIM